MWYEVRTCGAMLSPVSYVPRYCSSYVVVGQCCTNSALTRSRLPSSSSQLPYLNHQIVPYSSRVLRRAFSPAPPSSRLLRPASLIALSSTRVLAHAFSNSFSLSHLRRTCLIVPCSSHRSFVPSSSQLPYGAALMAPFSSHYAYSLESLLRPVLPAGIVGTTCTSCEPHPRAAEARHVCRLPKDSPWSG